MRNISFLMIRGNRLGKNTIDYPLGEREVGCLFSVSFICEKYWENSNGMVKGSVSVNARVSASRL